MVTVSQKSKASRSPSIGCVFSGVVFHVLKVAPWIGAFVIFYRVLMTAQSSPPLRTSSSYSTKHQPPSVQGIEGQPCRYDGHCGIGTTCGADKSSSLGGTCVKYHNASEVAKSTSPCVTACLEELKWEEYFRRGSEVEARRFSKVSGSTRRPAGCTIHYSRENVKKPWPGFTIDKFIEATRHHRVARMDPVIGANTRVQQWTAFCYEPCETTCNTEEGFVCAEGVCQRDEDAYWKPSDDIKFEMVIVTGANEDYFEGLKNLVGSLQYWAPKHKVVVYNLGLTEEFIEKVEGWGNVLTVKWRNGIPENYAAHVKSFPKKYAWKPIAIKEALLEYKQIFWLDAGSTVTGPITEAIRITQQTGIFLVKGQDEDMALSHPSTYEYFGYQKDTFHHGGHFSGNTQAYLYPSRYFDTLVAPNAECAVREECIAPADSHLFNHRYDQTTLSILAYRSDLVLPHYTQYLAADRFQLSDDLRKPSAMFVWTSRQTCWDFVDELKSKS